MRNILIILILTITTYGLRYVQLPCDGDTYIDFATPDSNYGTSQVLLSQVRFRYDGIDERDLQMRFPYFHYKLPENLIGKVKVREAGLAYFVNSFKVKTPDFKNTWFGVGLYPVIDAWAETSLTFTTSVNPASPTLAASSTPENTWMPKTGWNRVLISRTGLTHIQSLMDGVPNYGFISVVEIGIPEGSTMTLGEYNNEWNIASRESIHPSYMVIGYDLKHGVILNATKVENKSVGEIKAKYH